MATLHLPGYKSDWHKSTGRISYDPPRPGMKGDQRWWAILRCDPEITRYYRWWVDKEILNPLDMDKLGLKKPSWDAHISIIRGEKPRPADMHLWKAYEGQVVEYEYRHVVRRSGDTTPGERPEHYWFVEVRAPKLIEMRKEFGFPYHWSLHLTIGRTYD